MTHDEMAQELVLRMVSSVETESGEYYETTDGDELRRAITAAIAATARAAYERAAQVAEDYIACDYGDTLKPFRDQYGTEELPAAIRELAVRLL